MGWGHKPPINGPTMKLRAKTAPNNPWNRPRSRGLYRSPMIAMTIGKSAPAPRPWMVRKAINWFIFCEAPDNHEPTRNRHTPMINIALRPNTSENLPQMGTVTVDDSRYALTTHE